MNSSAEFFISKLMERLQLVAERYDLTVPENKEEKAIEKLLSEISQPVLTH